MIEAPIATLVDEARAGHRTALAKLLTIVERGGPEARELGRISYPLGGDSYTVGVTGAPGAGKSTLTNAVSAVVRAGGERMAILAVDPSSPFSGGAILGDRIRMGDHVLDEGVFIRSMATRGHLGGLALATPSALRVFDAVGYPWVILETVGVGQVEIEIMGSADTTIVVVNPGWGDAVQANKAGLMEIADIFVINKADRAGTAATHADLEQMLSMRVDDGWQPPIVETVATEGSGASELWSAVVGHREWLAASGEGAIRRDRRVRAEVQAIVTETLMALVSAAASRHEFDRAVDEVLARRCDPWVAADAVLAGVQDLTMTEDRDHG